MRSKVFAGLVLAGLVLATVPATAKDLSIKAFHGLWKGSAVSESEISSQFRVTARDLDVEIRPYAVGGFSLRWATVLRQEGNPSAPSETLRQAVVQFIPEPNRPGVWRDSNLVDPLSGDAFHWARIEDQTLIVYSLGVSATGSADIQIYRRTLSALGMKLEFSRIVDGSEVRSARGQLVKHAN